MSNVKGPDEAQNPDLNFEELVAQYQGSVLRMCFLYLCDKTLAEDAVQETFVKVYRGLNSFHGQSSIKTWIMKIAMRIVWIVGVFIFVPTFISGKTPYSSSYSFPSTEYWTIIRYVAS